MKGKIASVLGLSLLITSCGNNSPSVSVNETALESSLVTSSGPTYKANVLPLFQKYCATCHGPGSGMGNFLDYNTAFKKKDRILQKVTVDRSMPMGSNMTDDERNLVGKWVNDGAPSGEEASPAPPPAPTPQPTPTPIPTPPLPSVTYKEKIFPIMKKACSACHSTGSGLGNWLNYQEAYIKRNLISRYVTGDRSMPMPPYDKDITEQERKLIREWVKQGAPLDNLPN